MRLTVIFTALGLGACTTTPAMDSALAPLDGQPVQLVLERLGPPSSLTPTGAGAVYEWRSGKYVYGAGTRANLRAPSEGGAPAYGGMATPYGCDIRILVDAQGTIRDAQFGEQAGGCREPASKLREVALAEPR